MLSAGRVKPTLVDTGILVPRIHLELLAFEWRDTKVELESLEHLEI